MLYANEKDIKRCQSSVREMLKNKEINLSEEIIKKVTRDIMNISYSTGGDYSDSVITSYTKSYIEKMMYQKFLN